jgi:hypothetical protein
MTTNQHGEAHTIPVGARGSAGISVSVAANARSAEPGALTAAGDRNKDAQSTAQAEALRRVEAYLRQEQARRTL